MSKVEVKRDKPAELEKWEKEDRMILEKTPSPSNKRSKSTITNLSG